MSDWQPIETAPRDGKVILLYAITDNLDGPVKNWKTATGHWRTAYAMDENETGWVWDGHTLRTWDHQPTHWMPLPPPPLQRLEG